jgi:hypothetical protein
MIVSRDHYLGTHISDITPLSTLYLLLLFITNIEKVNQCFLCQFFSFFLTLFSLSFKLFVFTYTVLACYSVLFLFLETIIILLVCFSSLWYIFTSHALNHALDWFIYVSIAQKLFDFSVSCFTIYFSAFF